MRPVFGLTIDLPLDGIDPQLVGLFLAVVSYVLTGIKLARRIITRDRERLVRWFGPDQPHLIRPGIPEGLAGAVTFLAWPAVLAVALTCRAACGIGKGLAWLTVPPEAPTVAVKGVRRADATHIDAPDQWHLHAE